MTRRAPPGPPIPPRPSAPAGKPRPKDPIVAQYTDRVADRAKAAGNQQRAPMPNLGAAARDYRPEKDGPMTLGQISQAQGNIIKMTEEQKKPALSPATLAGLNAVHQATVAAQQPPMPEAPVAPPVAEKPAEQPRKVTETERQRLSEMPDIDFDLAMSRLKSDIINNEKEREAVKARVQPMDIADGIVTGEWKQRVPVVPDKLVVVFRTLSPMENEEIRKHCLLEALKDERFAEIQSERYGFMQVVASVHQVNGQEMPNHLKVVNGLKTFDWDVFNQKFNIFASYPAPFIAALSTHAAWFDMRVRELFATVNVKNG